MKEETELIPEKAFKNALVKSNRMKIPDEYIKWPNIKHYIYIYIYKNMYMCIHIHEMKGSGLNVQSIFSLHLCRCKRERGTWGGSGRLTVVSTSSQGLAAGTQGLQWLRLRQSLQSPHLCKTHTVFLTKKYIYILKNCIEKPETNQTP